MKILMVNKFLYPVGGAEQYMFSIANELEKEGHEIQFFGTDSKKNIVRNDWNILTKSYEDQILFNPFSLIYSKNAKMKMLNLLSLYKPDIVHMNNISFHLTSSIIDACKEKNIPVIMTIHDPQLVCCNHMFYRYEDKKVCTECLDGNFKHCLEHKCLHGSYLKSYLAYRESQLTHNLKKYDYVSYFIVPSLFLKNKLVDGGYDKNKLICLHNPIPNSLKKIISKKDDYILYYGRISQEKGIEILIDNLPKDINLIIAGKGPLEDKVKNKSNINYVGFKTGDELNNLISKAKLTVYPSIWYENCPLSIVESIYLGTPVVATNQGGIPELVKDNVTGLLFDINNPKDLSIKIKQLFYSTDYDCYVKNCLCDKQINIRDYCSTLSSIYERCILNEKNN